MAKVAQNLKSCQKVAEQLVAEPIAWTLSWSATPFKDILSQIFGQK